MLEINYIKWAAKFSDRLNLKVMLVGTAGSGGQGGGSGGRSYRFRVRVSGNEPFSIITVIIVM